MPGSDSWGDCLTPEEDRLICQFYYAKAAEICQFVKLSDAVQVREATLVGWLVTILHHD